MFGAIVVGSNLIVVLAIAVFLGFYFKISYLEWAMLVVAAGFVLAAEAFNAAIEIPVCLNVGASSAERR